MKLYPVEIKTRLSFEMLAEIDSIARRGGVTRSKAVRTAMYLGIPELRKRLEVGESFEQFSNKDAEQ